jgi:hypothetical protein
MPFFGKLLLFATPPPPQNNILSFDVVIIAKPALLVKIRTVSISQVVRQRNSHTKRTASDL